MQNRAAMRVCRRIARGEWHMPVTHLRRQSPVASLMDASGPRGAEVRND
jgi:hypothetical protein